MRARALREHIQFESFERGIANRDNIVAVAFANLENSQPKVDLLMAINLLRNVLLGWWLSTRLR